MQRYSKIYAKIPREIVLLKSFPCLYGKCTFCNYILDNSVDINEINVTNNEVFAQITGEFATLEIINSGSVFELPNNTLEQIKKIAETKNIATLYFEAYYAYRKRLNEIIDFFPRQEVRFRIGIETFDDDFRKNILNKPFKTDDLVTLSQEFYACCLLICVDGQTKEQILEDLSLAQKYFREITVNVFVNNTTIIKRDEKLVEWFVKDVYPAIKDLNNIEVLIDNKDLGVYVQ